MLSEASRSFCPLGRCFLVREGVLLVLVLFLLVLLLVLLLVAAAAGAAAACATVGATLLRLLPLLFHRLLLVVSSSAPAALLVVFFFGPFPHLQVEQILPHKLLFSLSAERILTAEATIAEMDYRPNMIEWMPKMVKMATNG